MEAAPWSGGGSTLRVKGQSVRLLVLCVYLQWSRYFKTTHGTKKLWSYIAGGLKIMVI